MRCAPARPTRSAPPPWGTPSLHLPVSSISAAARGQRAGGQCPYRPWQCLRGIRNDRCRTAAYPGMQWAAAERQSGENPVFKGIYRRSRRGMEERLAERVGFEPTVSLHPRRISSAVHSTTLPPLRPGEPKRAFRRSNRFSRGMKMRGRSARRRAISARQAACQGGIRPVRAAKLVCCAATP